MNLLTLVKRNHESFGTKVFYLFTLFIVIIYFSFSAFFIYYQSKALRQQLLNEGMQLRDILAYSSRLGVFAENKDLFKGPMEGVMQYKEVMLVQVYTADGRKLESLERPEFEDVEHRAERDWQSRDRAMERIHKTKSGIHFRDGDSIEFWAPVVTGRGYSEEGLYFRDQVSDTENNIIGFVRIVLTTRLLHTSLKDVFLKSIIIPVFFMIPGWIIAYIIVKGITKPLSRLTDGVRKIETGWLFEKVTVETQDEIGQLASAFNDMAESLRKREEEKQQLEEQLRHSQKMEAMGTLAGGIAHDFNNIITVIKSYGRLLQKKNLNGDDERHFVKQILASADKAVALTQGLLTFSRKQILNPYPVNLNRIIKNIEDILRRILTEDIELKVEVPEKDLIVIGDSGQLEHVLINLATNASDAMPEGGSLTITAKSVEPGRHTAHATGTDATGRYAVISVHDTGGGIDRQTKERMFDPFFTTKAIGKGTGLGLSMVYGIIKQHKGYIDVVSEPDKGTTFNVYIPLSDSMLVDKEQDEVPEPEGGTETVLVAEDDADVRRLITEVLTEYGYKVIETADGKEAIEKFINNKDTIDFLLLDVMMPKKNGKEVYEEIRKIRSDIRALFISGYAADISVNKETAAGEVVFLSKPVVPDELIRKVREILDT